jgi:hypothetical protein
MKKKIGFLFKETFFLRGWYLDWVSVLEGFDDLEVFMKMMQSGEAIPLCEGCRWITRKRPAL